MAAGPSIYQVNAWMRTATKKAAEFTKQSGHLCTPRLQRASNGEACVVYDVFKDDSKQTVLTLKGL